MPDVLIRDIPEDLLARLEARAKVDGRSLESELREILAGAAPSAAERAARIRAFREKYGLIRASRMPEDLITEDREQR